MVDSNFHRMAAIQLICKLLTVDNFTHKTIIVSYSGSPGGTVVLGHEYVGFGLLWLIWVLCSFVELHYNAVSADEGLGYLLLFL